MTQWQLGLYAEDTIKLLPRLTFTTGLRYSFQTTPGSFDIFGPRAGFAWAVDKKETWVSHLRAGSYAIELGPVERTGAVGTIRSIYLRDPDLNLIEIGNYLVR